MDLKLAGKCNLLAPFEKLWQSKIKYLAEHALNSCLASCPTSRDAQRVRERFVDQIIILVRSGGIRDQLNLAPDVKGHVAALAYRAQGTALYHPRVCNYIEALKYFNASIAHTELNSVDRGIAYANRSIVCMELHQYEDCVVNVRLARASNYPVRFLPKLAAREARAQHALQRIRTINAWKQKNGHWSADRNWQQQEKKPLAAANGAEELSTKLGPHLHGLAVVEYEHLYARCNYCHSRRLFTFIPCEGCTVAMFCSVACLTEAYRKYHRYECGLVRDLWRIGGAGAVTAFRRVAAELASFPDVPSSAEYLELFVAMKGYCAVADGLEGPTVQEHDHRQLPYRIFLTDIIHQLMVERTVLGFCCIEDPRISRLLSRRKKNCSSSSLTRLKPTTRDWHDAQRHLKKWESCSACLLAEWSGSKVEKLEGHLLAGSDRSGCYHSQAAIEQMDWGHVRAVCVCRSSSSNRSLRLDEHGLQSGPSSVRSSSNPCTK
uniref:MYND-type domain-containing protein n=1 Tax=Anopheles merus TaxID=30066 RepID=A0A182VE49_ANOME